MAIRRMRISYWMPKTTNTHPEYVTLYFSTATMVERTRLNVTLYVHFLSSLNSERLAKMNSV
jgi:hypothetical protein